MLILVCIKIFICSNAELGLLKEHLAFYTGTDLRLVSIQKHFNIHVPT